MDPTPRIETLLRERTRFRKLVHEVSCSSTQDLAAQHPGAGDAVFWADHQSHGRGRMQREWHDEPGADLAVTFRVTTKLPIPTALPAALPVAVLLACEPFAGRPLRIKWPNDVFLDGRKLAGVLVDAGVGTRDTYLIGIGVNVNRVRFPPDLEATACSLATATGQEVDRGALLLGIAERVHTALGELEAGQHEALAAIFRARLGLFGQQVRVEAAQPHDGVLTALDFERLVLDEKVTLPLAIVRSIQRLEA